MRNSLIYSKPISQAASLRTKILGALIFVTGAAILLYGTNKLSEANTLRYEKLRIAGVVGQIFGSNRGFPILSVNGQRLYINHIPPAFGKYISPGDSVYKPSGEFTVTTYRKVGACVEVIIWQYGIVNGYIQPDIRTEKRCQ